MANTANGSINGTMNGHTRSQILKIKRTSADEETHEETPLLGEQRYSAFNDRQKRWIILTAALASTFSPFSANIYYPALNSIATDLHISASLINLTIMTYMVSQLLKRYLCAFF